MTSKDFTIWLKGYLDACCELNKDRTQFIKNKLDEIVDHEIIYPITPNPYIPPQPYRYPNIGDYSWNQCPMGGPHEYPDVWHSILPAPCKKCGQSPNIYPITYCGTSSSHVEFEVPKESIVSQVCVDEGVSHIRISVPVVSTYAWNTKEGQEEYKQFVDNNFGIHIKPIDNFPPPPKCPFN